jgi:hypothetical protein
MDFLKDIWDTEGPLGIPMKDKQALAIEELLKSLPRTEDYQPRRVILKDAMTEFAPGERADVSWISTEDRDRDLEVVLSKGMNDEAFKLNPIVTVNHSYYCPPAGRSFWRKKGGRKGDRPLASETFRNWTDNIRGALTAFVGV